MLSTLHNVHGFAQTLSTSRAPTFPAHLPVRSCMRVGVPKEVKNHEYRVAITPVGVHELVAHGHQVFVQQGAGAGSSIDDDEYIVAGATIVADADDTWGEADLVLKVKEPVAEEYHRLRE